MKPCDDLRKRNGPESAIRPNPYPGAYMSKRYAPMHVLSSRKGAWLSMTQLAPEILTSKPTVPLVLGHPCGHHIRWKGKRESIETSPPVFRVFAEEVTCWARSYVQSLPLPEMVRVRAPLTERSQFWQPVRAIISNNHCETGPMCTHELHVTKSKPNDA
jgi:hypothetical protein